MAERLQTLVQYLVGFPGERALSYLARVAECFVLDLRAELAIMARSVLDTAIEDLAPDDTVRAALALPSNHRVGLSNRITYCEDLHTGPIFRPEAAAAAKRVKSTGDDAAHFVPGLERDPEALLSDLVVCLKELEGRGRPAGN